MAKYETMWTMGASDLRNACIAHNWYTRGDCNAYDHLLTNIPNELDGDALVDIALDIAEHSDRTVYDCTITEFAEDVVFHLLNEGYVHQFMKINGERI